VAGYIGDWYGNPAVYGNGRPQTFAGSLAYGGASYAAGTGNHIGVLNYAGDDFGEPNCGQMFRKLDSSLAVTSTTAGTFYLSWLFKSGLEASGIPYQHLLLSNGTGGRTFSAGLSFNDEPAGTTFDYEVNNAAYNTGVNENATVNLFVVKFDLSAAAGADNITVWLNPTLGAGDPSGGMAVTGTDMTFDTLGIADYAANSAKWDEIRWGTSFNDVTTAPIPEPSATILGGLGMLALLRRRRTSVSVIR
jgi:hypothetical protein